MNIGGQAWDAAGLIWYEALKASGETTGFQEFAESTAAKAGQFFGADSREQKAVVDGWADVGIRIMAPNEALARALAGAGGRGPDRDAESLSDLQRHVDVLSEQIGSMAKELSALQRGKSDGPGATGSARNSQAAGERRSEKNRRDQL